MTKELREMRDILISVAEREAIKLWRLARNCIKHGVSAELVREIREEANYLHTNITAYPERLVKWDAKYNFKYAFKC